MRINSLSLTNFGSYYGEEASIDFNSDTGMDGYAIFGQIGRGKTTILKAILWCLYGQVEASVSINEKIHTRPRPVVDREQHEGKKRWYLPLLNDKAYLEGNYEMQVSIDFEHEGSQYSLLRAVSPKSPSKKPEIDSDMNLEVHLQKGRKSVPAGRIGSTIEEIMPEKISRFFFVEVDSISSYSELLYSEETGGSIVEEVEAILGMPALDDSEEDFTLLAEDADKLVVKEKKKVAGITRDSRKLEKIESSLSEMSVELQNFQQQVEHYNSLIEKIEVQLSAETSVTALIEEKRKISLEMEKREAEMSELYEKRKEILGGSVWTCLLQRAIDSTITDLELQQDKKEAANHDRITKLERISLLNLEIRHGGGKCKVCGNESTGITQEESDRKASEMVDLQREVEEHDKIIGEIGHPSSEIIRLVKYKNSSGFSVLSDNEWRMGEITVQISTMKKSLKKIERELDQHDSIKIANLSKERRELIERVGDLRGQMGEIKRLVDEHMIEKKRLEDRLPDVSEDTKVKEANTKSKIYKWLSRVFKSAMDEYKDSARKSVQKISTDAWMKMIPTPGKYKELRLDQNWNVVVIGSNGKPLSIGNPGHRQTLAVCIFDGLRRTSDLQFPTFFDNPGSNISSEVTENMAEYFWADKSGQMVMLSHSGGLKQDESIERYGKRLAGAWEITYSEGEDAISQIERVV